MTRTTSILTILALLSLTSALSAWEQRRVVDAVPAITENTVYNSEMVRSVIHQTVSEYQEQMQMLPPVEQDTSAYSADCCGEPCCATWEAGVDVLFVRPYIGLDHGARISVDSLTTAPQYDYEASPRVWLRWEGCAGYGARVRWWRLDQESDTVTLVDAAFTEVGFTSTELDVLDLELTVRGCCCGWDLLTTGGLRYIDFSHDRTGTSTPLTVANSFREFDQTDFEAYGPTLAVEARYPMCGCVTPFINIRGSLLTGDEEKVLLDQTFDPGANLISENTNTFIWDEITYTLEMQIGAEWTRCTNYGELFVSASVEGQYWNRIGALLESGTSNQREDHKHMFIFGGVLTAGVRR